MITRKTLRGPSGGMKVHSIDKLGAEKALGSMRMDLDLDFKVIQTSETSVLLEYYEGEQYEMGTHIQYTGPKREMEKIVSHARAFDMLTAAPA